MEIRQLEYFFAVAKYLSFTKAAEYLYVGQPNLSRKIAELEEQIGVQLFVRDNRSVRLSPAGEVLLKEGQALVARMHEIIEKTRKVGSGKTGTLNIGSVELHNIYLSKLVRNFRARFPHVSLNLSRFTYGTLSEALINEKVDIGFCPFVEVEDFSGLEWKFVDRNPICALLPLDHPLANKQEINIADLAQESFVFIQSAGLEEFLRSCAETGFKPKVVNFIRNPLALETLILQVEAGIGISMVTRKAVGNQPSGLRLVDLKGIKAAVDEVVAWKKGNINSSLPLFLEDVFSVQHHPTDNC